MVGSNRLILGFAWFATVAAFASLAAPAQSAGAAAAKKKAVAKTSSAKAAKPGASAKASKTGSGGGGAAAVVQAILRVPVIDVLRAPVASKTFAASPDQAPVAVGDRLKTDGQGRGWVDFADGSVLRVSTATEVSVTELAVSQTARRVRVNLTAGSLYAHVSKVSGSDSTWSVDTPVGVATARGTAFSVTCVASVCTVAVAEGQVRVTNARGTVDVEPGTQSVLRTNAAPTPSTSLNSDADSIGGSWLLCNAARDDITTPNSSFAAPTVSDCDFRLGPKLPPTTGLPLIVVTGAAAGGSGLTTTTSATNTTTTSTVSATTTTTVFPTRPSFFAGTGGLTATMIENPFRCNGVQRSYVNYAGLVPGESLTWVWGVSGLPPDRTGTSSAGGTTGQSPWSCSPAQAGTVWTFTLTGSSGHSVTYDLVGGPP